MVKTFHFIRLRRRPAKYYGFETFATTLSNATSFTSLWKFCFIYKKVNLTWVPGRKNAERWMTERKMTNVEWPNEDWSNEERSNEERSNEKWSNEEWSNEEWLNIEYKDHWMSKRRVTERARHEMTEFVIPSVFVKKSKWTLLRTYY